MYWLRLLRSFSARVCVLVIFYGVILLATVQGQTESKPELTPLQENLLKANSALTQLIPLLQTQENRIASLQADLVTLDGQLQISQASLQKAEDSSAMLASQLADSQQAVANSEAARLKVQDSLDSLSTQYDALSVSWEAYRQEMQGQVLAVGRERDFWKAATITVSIIGTGLIILLALLL